MKKNHLLLLLSLTFFVFSCQKDDDEELLPDGDPIELSGNQNTPLTLENRFENPNIPDYIVTGNWNINAPVIIEPGVRIEVQSGRRINVSSDASLSAVGTPELPITITGATQTKGFWDYLRFQGSNNPDNKLIYVDISYGGGNTISSADAMVIVTGNGQVTIQNSHIRHSARNGLRANDTGATLPDFRDNVLEHNEMHPIRLRSALQLAGFDGSNAFTSNNGFNSIRVQGSTIQTSLNIGDLNGPVNLDGTTEFQSDAVFEPGLQIDMASSARIIVSQNGSLNAIGTASNPITITGAAEAKGYWDYIRIRSNNPLNEFQYVDISYGGGNTMSSMQGSIVISDTGFFKLGNSSVTNSQRYGIHINSNNATFEDEGNNTFSGNENGDIRFP